MKIMIMLTDFLTPMWEFEGAQAAVLEMFDRNRDGRLAQEDFAWSFSPKDTFHEVLVQSFAVTGAFKYPKTQPDGLRRALRLFDTIHQVRARLKLPQEKTVPYAEWKLAQEAVEGVALQLNDLHPEMAMVAYLLSGKPGIPAGDWDALWAHSRKGLDPEAAVDWEQLPRVSVNDCALQNHMGLLEFMRQLEKAYGNIVYDVQSLYQIQCKGNGCHLGSKHLDTDALLRPLRVTGGANATVVVPKPLTPLPVEPPRRSDWACFAGGTYIRGQDTTPYPITAYTPDNLITSYDECNGFPLMIDQHPAEYQVHRMLQSVLLTIHIETGNHQTAGLQVTPEHPLLTVDHGMYVWKEAGELKPFDQLADGFGKGPHAVKRIDRQEGKFDLYNFRFSGAQEHPNYLVSPDGLTWVVAHNVK